MAKTLSFQDMAGLFAVLSDPKRLGILWTLRFGPKNATAICKGALIKLPAASHNLGLMRMSRLVNGTRRGRSTMYTSNAECLKALIAGLTTLVPKR